MSGSGGSGGAGTGDAGDAAAAAAAAVASNAPGPTAAQGAPTGYGTGSIGVSVSASDGTNATTGVHGFDAAPSTSGDAAPSTSGYGAPTGGGGEQGASLGLGRYGVLGTLGDAAPVGHVTASPLGPPSFPTGQMGSVTAPNPQGYGGPTSDLALAKLSGLLGGTGAQFGFGDQPGASPGIPGVSSIAPNSQGFGLGSGLGPGLGGGLGSLGEGVPGVPYGGPGGPGGIVATSTGFPFGQIGAPAPPGLAAMGPPGQPLAAMGPTGQPGSQASNSVSPAVLAALAQAHSFAPTLGRPGAQTAPNALGMVTGQNANAMGALMQSSPALSAYFGGRYS